MGRTYRFEIRKKMQMGNDEYKGAGQHGPSWWGLLHKGTSQFQASPSEFSRKGRGRAAQRERADKRAGQGECEPTLGLPRASVHSTNMSLDSWRESLFLGRNIHWKWGFGDFFPPKVQAWRPEAPPDSMFGLNLRVHFYLCSRKPIRITLRNVKILVMITFMEC